MRPGNGGQRGDNSTPLRRPRRRDLLSLLGIGAAAGLAGCAGGGDATPTDPGDGSGGTSPSDGERTVTGDYVTATGSDAQSLNWLSIADTTSGSYIQATMDGAWTVTSDDEVFPLWADVATDDKRVYEITLRDHLEWSEPYGQMTADDWIYVIQNVFQAPDNWAGYPNASDWFASGEPVPVEKTGTYSFDVRLPEIDPAWPLKPIMWGQQCMPRGLLERYVPDRDVEGLKQDEEVQTLAYTGNLGPYTYEEWDRESQFVTVRNPDYYMHDAADVPDVWRGAPYFERNVVKVIPEESSRLGALRAGEISSAGIPPDKANQFEDVDGLYLNVAPQAFVSILTLNQRANGWRPARTPGVRVAIAQAIDKTAIVENILRGYARTAHTMQPEFSRWYESDRVQEYGVDDQYGADVARATMADAIADTDHAYNGDILEGPDGDQVELRFIFSSASPTNQTVAEYIAQELEANLGIASTLTGVPGNTFLQKYAMNAPPEGEDVPWSASSFNGGPRDVSVSQEPWDLSTSVGFNTYPRTPTATRVFFTERANTNFYGYVPSYDFESLYATASSAVDEEVRREALAEIFGKLSRDQPFVFYSMSSSITGYRETVVGPTEEFGYGWDSNTWYVDPA